MRRNRYGVLGLLIALSMITFLDRLAIAVAGPRIQDALHISPDRWGWVLGAFALAYGIFEMPAGAAGDRIGPRRVLTRIVIWWSAFTALTGAATGYLELIATQFFFGAGEAGAYPNASGVIVRWFPRAERARAQGAVWAASRLGGALSPLLVVPLLRAVGWRLMFVILSGFGLLWVIAWRIWYREDAPFASPAHSGSIATVFGSRQTWLLMAMYFCYVWGSWFYFSWFPTYLVKGAGFSEAEMGTYAALPFILGCIGNLAGGALSDFLAARFSLKIARCGQASTALALSSLLIFALAHTQSKSMVIVLASAGFGVLDLMLPATWALCIDLGQSRSGLLSGAMNSAGLAGGFLCSVIFGYLVRSTGGYRVPLTLVAAMVMLSAVLFLFIDPSATSHVLPPVPDSIEPAPSR